LTLTAHVTLFIARVSTFYDKGPQPVERTASWAARGKTAVSCIPNCLIYCEFFSVHTQFTKSGSGPHNKLWVRWPRVGTLWRKGY